MRNMIIFAFIALGAINTAEASSSTKCLRNNVAGTVYIYDNTEKLLGSIKATDKMTGISDSSFPLTVSVCSQGPSLCDESFENDTIKSPGCYLLDNLGGIYHTDLTCWSC